MIYWGLFRRKETLTLSWRGWLFFLVITFATLLIIARYVRPFLAISRPTYGDILVVEGWVTDTVLEQAASFFHKHECQLIVTVGAFSKKPTLIQSTSFSPVAVYQINNPTSQTQWNNQYTEHKCHNHCLIEVYS